MWWKNHSGGAMVSILASSAVDRGFEPQSGQTKDYKIVFAASLLIIQHSGVRAKVCCLGIRIMCTRKATCPTKDCSLSELSL